VSGGSTFWLKHCVEKGNWTHKLVDACRDPTQAVYCRQSAGSILFGQSVETACWKGSDDPSIVSDMETYESWKGVEGLGLAGDLSVFLHSIEDKWDTLLSEREEDITSEVYRMTNADA
jgi:peptidase E